MCDSCTAILSATLTLFRFGVFVDFLNYIKIMSNRNLIKSDFRKLATVHLTKSSQDVEAVFNKE